MTEIKEYCLDPSNFTDETLKIIVQLTNEQKKDLFIREYAENIVRYVPEKNFYKEIEVIFNFVKNHMRYTRDIYRIETIKTPLHHLKKIKLRTISFGDCDDHSILVATLLSSIGYKTRYAVIKTKYNNPMLTFNHIYVEVLEPLSKIWISLDATAKDKQMNWKPEHIVIKYYYV
ncbi:MAG: transglutaminase-like domain-containing protein [Candidatus Omnitrophica bacterium]|nr:transglutaminase-like domain-containing protein [Candidatus Omnitrophota bacterium]